MTKLPKWLRDEDAHARAVRAAHVSIGDAMALGTAQGAISALSPDAYGRLKDWMAQHEATHPELRQRRPDSGVW